MATMGLGDYLLVILGALWFGEVGLIAFLYARTPGRSPREAR